MSNLYQIAENVKNLPENSPQSQSIMHHNINNIENKPQKITIQPHQNNQENYSLITQPYPKRPKKHQISFEKDFLVEHIRSLQRQLQNTIEFAFKIKVRQKMQTIQSIRCLYLSSVNEVNVLSFLKSQHEPSWDVYMDSFQRDLQHNDDIENFLKHIISCSTRQLAIQLITIVLGAWAEFRNFNFSFLEKKQILKKGNDWGKQSSVQYYQSANFNLLNGKIFAIQNPQDNKLSHQRFDHFVRFLTSTVLLIMAGYFQNPYFDPNFCYKQEAHVDHHKRWFSQAFYGFLSDFQDNSLSQSSLVSSKRSKGN